MANKGIQKPRPRLPRSKAYAKIPSFNLAKRKTQFSAGKGLSPASESVTNQNSIVSKWFSNETGIRDVLRAAPMMQRKTAQKNVGKDADQRTSSLVELMYQAPTMFPTNSVELRPYVRKSFLPSNQHASLPQPMDFNALLEQKRNLDDAAYNFDRDPDLNIVSRVKDIRDPSGVAGSRTSQLYKESFNENFRLGSENEARRRVRVILDKLHGTAAGGRPGVSTLKVIEKEMP